VRKWKNTMCSAGVTRSLNIAMPDSPRTHHGAVNSALRNTAPSRCTDFSTSESASMGVSVKNGGVWVKTLCAAVPILATPARAGNFSSPPLPLQTENDMSAPYQGSCFCGAVQFTVTGEPAAMGYCHCESCRTWSAGPVNAFTLWNPEAVKITRGADNIGSYN